MVKIINQKKLIINNGKEEDKIHNNTLNSNTENIVNKDKNITDNSLIINKDKKTIKLVIELII